MDKIEQNDGILEISAIFNSFKIGSTIPFFICEFQKLLSSLIEKKQIIEFMKNSFEKSKKITVEEEQSFDKIIHDMNLLSQKFENFFRKVYEFEQTFSFKQPRADASSVEILDSDFLPNENNMPLRTYSDEI